MNKLALTFAICATTFATPTISETSDPQSQDTNIELRKNLMFSEDAFYEFAIDNELKPHAMSDALAPNGYSNGHWHLLQNSDTNHWQIYIKSDVTKSFRLSSFGNHSEYNVGRYNSIPVSIDGDTPSTCHNLSERFPGRGFDIIFSGLDEATTPHTMIHVLTAKMYNFSDISTQNRRALIVRQAPGSHDCERPQAIRDVNFSRSLTPMSSPH